LLVDARGVPLSLIVKGANVHDVKLLAATLDQKVIQQPAAEEKPHLCADAGYKGEPAQQEVIERGYQPCIKQRREEAEEKKRDPNKKARRWVVERTHSWLNRFRKILVRFEKTDLAYLGLLQLACAMICWRTTIVIYG
jgi:putative transposase